MKVAWLFPGQGSQEVGMGADVCRGSASASAVYAEADQALGEAISQLCFEGPLDALTLTRNTQPAIVATSCAIVAAIREHYPALATPAYAAGHSLGEYSALVAAGALSLCAAVRLCRLRGLAMQETVPEGVGAMAAVIGLGVHEVAPICDQAAQGQVVAPANFNAPTQIVIAGHAEAVKRASVLVAKAGGKAVLLNVSAPFHCALMRGAAAQLAPEIERVSICPLQFPVIANTDGVPHTDPDGVRELLIRQVDSPVQWVKSVEHMAAAGVTHALEIGPGRVLGGLVRRIAKDIRVLGVSTMSGISALPQFLSGRD